MQQKRGTLYLSTKLFSDNVTVRREQVYVLDDPQQTQAMVITKLWCLFCSSIIVARFQNLEKNYCTLTFW